MIDPSAAEDLKLIEDAKSDLEAAQAVLRRTKDSYVEKHRRYAEGDELPVNGISHTGKIMVVESCQFRAHPCATPKLVYFGRIKKKNGEIGQQRGEYHDPIHVTQEEANKEEKSGVWIIY